MKVIVRESAEDDVDQVFARVAKDNPRVAVEVVSRIRKHVNRLETDSLAQMG